RAVSLGYRAAWRVVRALPERVVAPGFRLAADAAYRRGGPGVDRLAANLRRVVGPDLPEDDLRDLVRAGMRSYARYWMETFRLPAWSRDDIVRRFVLVNDEVLREVLAAGRGAVVALPHAGNWDLAGAWASVTGMPLTTVAERLRPEDLYERFLAYRTSLGMEILPLTGGDRPVLDVLADRLREGRLVPLLADRDLSARGVQVDFFGGRTRMPPGPALLALRTGAPLFAFGMWNTADQTHGRLYGPIPVPTVGDLSERVAALTQAVADELARGIAGHPEDWHMLQRLWLDDPGPGGRARGAARAPARVADG
ncbi:MAG TPA: phosphatidylinositol mannoside acyltransferase, partial [Cryptosporangiaceae bacterium]|nr:phosphatidylinositol mannoside acyltransferase [Cryptosporangiaceae bacterium]